MKNFIIKTLFPLLRGVFKSIPMGTPIYELLQNLFFQKKINVEGIKTDVAHNYKSIAMQLLFGAVILACFVLKIITFEELINYINVFK